MYPIVVASPPGFELLVADRRSGPVHACPVLAWSMALREDGEVDYVRPVACGIARGNPEVAYALKRPDGLVQPLDGTVVDILPLCVATYDTVEEWLFAVRARASGHALLWGSA